jgi:hypothetical protein
MWKDLKKCAAWLKEEKFKVVDKLVWLLEIGIIKKRQSSLYQDRNWSVLTQYRIKDLKVLTHLKDFALREHARESHASGHSAT